MKLGKKGRAVIITFITFGMAFLILMSPLFAIDNVNVIGNEKFSEQQIMRISGVNTRQNIFRISYSKAEQKLLNETYIKFAEIAVKLPNSVNIEIIERKTCGYVPYMGTYLYIDSDGFVLENSSEMDGNCPVVTGLKFNEFTVGEQLKVENTISFDIVMTMARLLLNYNYLDSVREMNITSPDDIHLYVGNIDISFGDIAEADKKIRTVIEIMKNFTEEDKGILHIEDLQNTPYFSYTL